MALTRTKVQPVGRGRSLRHDFRIVAVLAGSEFKLKYAGSVLGYVWSLAKPLALFSVLYVIFGLLIQITSYENYALLLLLGIVLYLFFAEATTATMQSVVQRGRLIRRIAFPRLIIPISVSVTALFTFALNVAVIAALVGWNRIAPRLDWLFLIPLVFELYLFSLGVSLILATLYVRFRDVGQVWELVVQLLFYVSPIIYPIQLLPGWAQKAVLINPLAQMIQDARATILYRDSIPTIPAVYGSTVPRLLPFAIVILVFVGGVWLFRREAPRFAERV